ncbi:hypothetical protein ACRC7T_18730 (plasmid) [Segnochrobactraceae bacterium EtOH-i3]
MFVDRDVKPAVAHVEDTGDDALILPVWWPDWPTGQGEKHVTRDPQEWAARVSSRYHTRPAAGRVALAIAEQVPDGAGVVSLSGIKASAHVSRQVIADTLATLSRAGLLELRTGIAIDRRDVRLLA